MQITVIAVGNKMPSWVDEAFTQYCKRLNQEIKIVLKEIKPVRRTDTVNAHQGILQEENKILETIPDNCILVALDERGKAFRSITFSQQLTQWLADGQNLCFVIGGADGLGEQIKKRANLLLRLSDMTLPHGLARVLLVEQIYRAWSILHAHPYHRE